LRSIYYSVLRHVSATGYGHVQGATYFTDVYGIYCKWPYRNSKNVGVGFLSLYSDNIVMSLYNEV